MVKNFWKNKRVLVTGYEGFLGSHLTKALLSKGAKVVGLDKVKNRPLSVLADLRGEIACIEGNLGKLKLVRDVVGKYRPQAIFHLAAEAIVGEAIRYPLQTFRSNIEGTWNILEAARDKRFIESIVAASSDKAYGSHNELPYREETALRGVHPYDVSKSCADLISHTYYNTYNVPVCVSRCGNVFGPGDFHFSRIVPDIIRSALREKTLLIRSNGKYTRDYIYVEDVIDGYLVLAEKMQRLKLFGEAFNFSNEKAISVLQLVEIIYKLCNKKPDYKIFNKARFEIRNQYLSAKKAKKILAWKPKYQLEEALKKTISWYKDCL